MYRHRFLFGVGKSGFICHKIAMSLASIGVRAAFLSPLDALHGDIGNCGHGDLLVLFSKSGSTSELLAIIPGARSKNMKIISIICSQHSVLSVKSDIAILLPLQRELCDTILLLSHPQLCNLFSATRSLRLLCES